MNSDESKHRPSQREEMLFLSPLVPKDSSSSVLLFLCSSIVAAYFTATGESVPRKYMYHASQLTLMDADTDKSLHKIMTFPNRNWISRWPGIFLGVWSDKHSCMHVRLFTVNHLVRACEPDARKILVGLVIFSIFSLTSQAGLINFLEQNLFFFQTYFLNFVKDSPVAVTYVWNTTRQYTLLYTGYFRNLYRLLYLLVYR